MTSNQSLASNFKESKSDLNEILKKFANRNKSDDYFELIKLGKIKKINAFILELFISKQE